MNGSTPDADPTHVEHLIDHLQAVLDEADGASPGDRKVFDTEVAAEAAAIIDSYIVGGEDDMALPEISSVAVAEALADELSALCIDELGLSPDSSLKDLDPNDEEMYGLQKRTLELMEHALVSGAALESSAPEDGPDDANETEAEPTAAETAQQEILSHILDGTSISAPLDTLSATDLRAAIEAFEAEFGGAEVLGIVVEDLENIPAQMDGAALQRYLNVVESLKNLEEDTGEEVEPARTDKRAVMVDNSEEVVSTADLDAGHRTPTFGADRTGYYTVELGLSGDEPVADEDDPLADPEDTY